MFQSTDLDIPLVLTREVSLADDPLERPHRAAAAGRMVRLRRGVYVDSDDWAQANPLERHILRVRAVVLTRQVPCAITHQSAAALWGIPRLRLWPTDVHIMSLAAGGLHSRNGVQCHTEAVPDSELVDWGGFTVTSLARTVVDLARTESFVEAVVALDSVLRRVGDALPTELAPDALRDHLGRTCSRRGVARAARVIDFGDGRSANPGESFSRTVIHRLGFAAPELQRAHANPRGGSYFTDFEWPDARVIGEFDGRAKYLEQRYLRGMSAGEAVVAEKIREDDLRSEGNSVVRWTWDDLRVPGRLEQALLRAGVPKLRRA